MGKAERYIKNFTRKCSNELDFGGFAPWLSPENAMEAVEIARKEIMEKVCSYIKSHSVIDIKELESL